MQLKICGSHLTCKVANKGLNAHELLDVIERNKNGPFSSPAVLWIISVWKKKNTDRKKEQYPWQIGFHHTCNSFQYQQPIVWMFRHSWILDSFPGTYPDQCWLFSTTMGAQKNSKFSPCTKKVFQASKSWRRNYLYWNQ